MSHNRLLLLLGVWVFLIPVIGFPFQTMRSLLLGTGIIIALVAITRHQKNTL